MAIHTLAILHKKTLLFCVLTKLKRGFMVKCYKNIKKTLIRRVICGKMRKVYRR